MNTKEAIEILDDGEWWCHLDMWYEAENPENIKLHDAVDVAIAALRAQREREKNVETNCFDKEEIYEDCTVQVLTNTVTGEVSVGWWQNDKR